MGCRGLQTDRLALQYAPIYKNFAKTHKNGVMAERSDLPVFTKPVHVRRGILIGAALIGLVVVGVALWLPPFSLGSRLFPKPMSVVGAATPLVYSDDTGRLTIMSVDAAASFDMRLTGSLNIEDDVGWWEAARAVLPAQITLLSPIYRLDTAERGTAVRMVFERMMPEGADAYRYTRRTGQWTFVPGLTVTDPGVASVTLADVPEAVALVQSVPTTPLFGLIVEPGDTLTTELRDRVDAVYVAGLQPDASGALVGSLPYGATADGSRATVMLIRDPGVVAASLLRDEATRQAHLDMLLDLAFSQRYAGLALDYGTLPDDVRSGYLMLLADLADGLHASGRSLTVILHDSGADPTAEAVAYYQQVGLLADTVVLPLTDANDANRRLDRMTSAIDRRKLLLLVSASSQKDDSDGRIRELPFSEAINALGVVTRLSGRVAAPGEPIRVMLQTAGRMAVQFVPVDSRSGELPAIAFTILEKPSAVTLRLMTPGAISQRLSIALGHQFGGAVVAGAAAEGAVPGVADIARRFTLREPTVVQPEALRLQWRVYGVTGTDRVLLGRFDGAPGQEFSFVPDASYPRIDIAAELVGADVTLGIAHIDVRQP